MGMRDNRIELLDSQIMACGRMMMEQSHVIARALNGEADKFTVVFSVKNGMPSTVMTMDRTDVLQF